MLADQRICDRAHGYSLHLDTTEPRLTAIGELDLAAAADLTEILAMVDARSARLQVDLSGVTFCDASALEPFVEATRRRAELGQSPIAIESSSHAVERLFEILGVDGHPLLDVAAWDRIATPRPTRVVDRRSQRLV